MKPPAFTPEYLQKQMEQYRLQIPQQLWEILLPQEGDDPSAFVQSVKRLRIAEQERDYVMAIQRRFGIPIRPDESVRESMTRVRAKILNRTMKTPGAAIRRRLPKDPLE